MARNKCVLNIDFHEDMKEVNATVMIRHDIIQRNSKVKKTGETHEFAKEEFIKCTDNVTKLINCIDNQLKILDSTTLGEIIKRSYFDRKE